MTITANSDGQDNQNDNHSEGDGESMVFLYRHAVQAGTDQSERLAVNGEVDSQMLSLVAGHRITSRSGPKSVIPISGTGNDLFFSNFATESMS